MAAPPPRFRRELPSAVIEADGVRYVEVTDTASEKTFRFYEMEHVVAQAFDGRPLAEVAASLRASAGLELTAEQLGEFADKLHELGFLAVPALPPSDDRLTPVVAMSPGGLAAAHDGLTDPEAALRPSQDDWSTQPTRAGELPLDGLGALDGDGDSEGHRPSRYITVPRPVTDIPSAAVAPHPAPPPVGDPPVKSVVIDAVGGRPGGLDDLVEIAAVAVEVASAAVSPPGVTPAPPEVPASPAPDAAATLPVPPAAIMPVITTAAAPDATAKLPRPAAGDSGHRVAKQSSSAAGFALVGFALAAGMGFYAWRTVSTREPPSLPVRTLVPSPTSVYRWFEAEGVIKEAGSTSLTFPAAGKVVEVLPTGARFKAGDPVALLDAARRVQTELAHNRERLGYYQQLLETARTAGNRPEVRQAEIKIVDKQKLVDDTLAELTKVAVVATEDGEVVESLVAVGTMVKPGTPAAHVKGDRRRGELVLPKEELETARRLPFCRAEIDGKPSECSFAADGPEDRLLVDFAADATMPQLPGGKSFRLAKARHDAVFAVPVTALLPGPGGDRVYVATAAGRVEVRPVALVDRTATLAIVGQGLDVGDVIIVEFPAGIGPQVRVQIIEQSRQ